MNNEDTELIITNNIEEQQAPAAGVAGDAAATGDKDVATPQDDGTIKEPEQSFREALREQIHEDDPTPKQNISLIKILGGDFFTSQILRRQIWLMVIIILFVIMYVSNRYSYQKSMLEIDKLNKELQDVKYKALSTSSRLTEQSRQSNVLEMLKNNKDSVLHIADQPPFKVEVPEK